ncbi:MAG: 3-mercaptopyruvate sulfurtransferase [Chloroflexi bacterium RBG_16_54_18]|nr:MAG: 3-mercaptopyruvate sulfurtransferase [Chloroflexi bacterium RBG_16_54_18]
MAFTTLIPATDLFSRLRDPEVRIFDCRFSLAAPDLKMQEYLQAHIPGSLYAHLERDLSGPVIPGKTGRHPLPEMDRLTDFFGKNGIDEGVQVVAYDDTGGAIASARLWWLLRWLGHEAVAVLDGGWQTWLEAGYPVSSGHESSSTSKFIPKPRPELIADAQEVWRISVQPAANLFDARSADRFRGENENIDPVAGHIPGARNVPYHNNLDETGRFRSRDRLRRQYLDLISATGSQQVVFYCGSGVTACHDLLAYYHAGLGEARLYPGSWSEWITSDLRPAAIGEDA